MRKFLVALFSSLLLVTGLAACSSPDQGSITITDPWVRSSEYSATAGGMTGIFAKITNTTNHDVTLIGGETDAAMMVQTHEVVDGMMQEKKGGIVIKAGETVTLEPGGLHVMLMNLTNPIVAGDQVKFTFKFDGADPQTFTLTAKPSSGGDETYSSN